MFLKLDDNSNGRPFLPTNSWRALKQRLLRTLELALVPLAGTRCSNCQIPVLNSILIQNLSVSSPNYPAVINQVTAAILSEQLPYYFPFFSKWIFLNSIPPECLFSGKYLSNLSSIHWVLLKDCLGLFWVSCHLMIHLLWSHFLGGSWPQI